MVRQEYGVELNFDGVEDEEFVEERDALLTDDLATEDWGDGFNLGLEMLTRAMDKREVVMNLPFGKEFELRRSLPW